MTNGILNCEAVAERGLVERYVSGRLSDDQGLGALEAHLLTCKTCREEVRLGLVVRAEFGTALDAQIQPDHEPGERAASVTRRRATDGERRRLRPGLLIGLAAAAAVVLVVQYRANWLELPRSGAHRGPTQASAPGPILRQPAGQVSTVPQVQWSAFAGADRYRVRLFNADGDLLWEAQATDTALRLPDSVRLAAGQRYYWTVAGQTGVGHWVESPLAPFVIRPSSHGR
jgi:hypothetical protein